MASKIHNGILILTLILFASCRTQKPAPRPAPPETVDFPTANIPLPVVDFNFMLPEAPRFVILLEKISRKPLRPVIKAR